mgnify:FL=1
MPNSLYEREVLRIGLRDERVRLWGQVTAVEGAAAGPRAVTTVTTLEGRVGTAREGLIVPVEHTMHPSASALNACNAHGRMHALCEPLHCTARPPP